MPRCRQSVAIAASSSGGMIVPVGLAGLAMISPRGAGSSAAIAAAVIWKRSAAPQPLSTGVRCRAYTA